MSTRSPWGVLLLLAFACTAQVKPASAPNANQVATITIGSKVLRTNVERFGINLSGQNFYDSGQMLRNLVSRNPGFEGEIWQSVLRCKTASATGCTEENQYTQWPAGFLNGAEFEVLSGQAAGQRGTVTSSTAAAPPYGVTLRFASLPHALHGGDFILIRMSKPGDPTAGWWPETHGGASFAAERKDLPPNTPGKQALLVEAAGPIKFAILHSYFDSTERHSFVQLHGPYELRFRAKPVNGSGSVGITLARLDTTHGRTEFLHQEVKLASGWHDYRFPFLAHEEGKAVGTVDLQFAFSGTSVLLDDVWLGSTNPSSAPAFRSEVVQTLRALHPGFLRYMDNGGSFGSTLENLLQPEFARQRAGYSTQDIRHEDIPIGLEDFLELCAAVGADPWISLPPALSPSEASQLTAFLAAPATSSEGGKRIVLGHRAPWTEKFNTIHLELGNEQWNSRSFAGGTIHDPVVYAHRAGEVFGAIRHSPYFASGHFDLIAGTWNAVPWWTGQELAAASNVDTLAIAPYLFSEFNDASSNEAVFGPMLAQPEQLDSRSDGSVARQTAEIRKSSRPTRLAVYEVNLGSMSGTATQSDLDRFVPSWGGGLAVADHMLLMLRDQGITTQALFCLPEFRNFFANTTSHGQETMPLWGAVVDMGGGNNRKRPVYLALQTVNTALLPNLLETTINGPNPTWDQPLSRNDKVQLRAAHELQTFAFAGGDERSLILLNLSRTQGHSVRLDGTNAPSGPVQETTLAPPHLTDNNETTETVRPVVTTLAAATLRRAITLQPGSMTVLRWKASPLSPR